MWRWAPYPVVRITLGFMAGILLFLFFGSDFRYTTEITAFFVFAFVAAALLSWKRKTAFATDLAGMLGLCGFVALGFAYTQHHREWPEPKHLSKLTGPPSHYVGTVADDVQQKNGYRRTVLEVSLVKVSGQWQEATGKVQLSLVQDSGPVADLHYGDVLLVKGAPQLMAAPANPGQFDYRQYLANKNIYHQHYLQPFHYQKISGETSWGVQSLSIQVRRYLDGVLRERINEKREYSISSALLLGVKDELDNSIRSAYADTGTMHVLAVSGLHVGILYGFLLWVLAAFDKTKGQSLFAVVLILAVLWGYAFVTGLSASVLRAVLMFSLVTVGIALRRRRQIYNTIAVAALALLAYNPYFLLDVGFQLSFLAVLGIVYLQPKLYRLLRSDSSILDFIWRYFTVAVAAQLATFPLGLLYFHQFPVYFWLANLVVVPMASLVLYSGLVALALHWVPGLSLLLFQLHFGFIWAINEFNLLVQDLPLALLNGFDISAGQACLLYAFLLLLILFLSLRQLHLLALAVGVLVILSGQAVLETWQQQKQQLLAVYQVRGATGMALVRGQEAVLLADSVLLGDAGKYSFSVQPHLWQLGVGQPAFVSLEAGQPVAEVLQTTLPDSNQLLVWKGQRWLILSHRPGVQPKTRLGVDYVLLRNNAPVKARELQRYTFRQVVIDGSNSFWYRHRLQKQLDALGVSYHDVAVSGAFVLEL